MLAIQERVLVAEHPDTAFSGYSFGDSLARQGKFQEAKPYLQRAEDTSLKAYGAGHPYRIKARECLEKIESRLHPR